jgi:predicted RNase H-like HicB family nuclease
MAVDQFRREVSRRIEAPVDRIFEILANPQRHTDLDGSEMLRGAVSDGMITGVGDVFSMKMFMDEVGDYVMMNYVVEFEVDRCIGWEPAPGDAAASEDGKYPIGVPAGHRWSFQLDPDGVDATIVTEVFDCSSASEELREAIENGESWIESMTTTLARLDTLCTQ